MSWQAQPKANGAAAWCCDEQEARLLAKVLRSHGLKIKIKSEQGNWYTSYTLYVIGDSDAVLRGRELRRGFKVAMQLRGDVYDFCEGLRAGLRAAEQAGMIRTQKPQRSRQMLERHVTRLLPG